MGHNKLMLIASVILASSCAHYTYQVDTSNLNKEKDPNAVLEQKPDAGKKVATNGTDAEKHVVIDNGVMFDPFGLAAANLRRAENEELAIKMRQPYYGSGVAGEVSESYYGAYGYDPVLAAADGYAQGAPVIPGAPGTPPSQATSKDAADAKAMADAALDTVAKTAEEVAKQRAELDKMKKKNSTPDQGVHQ
jgi:hypothetical protein